MYGEPLLPILCFPRTFYFAMSSPPKIPNPALNLGVLSGGTIQTKPRTTLPTTILDQKTHISLQALVDSCSEHNLICPKLVENYNLPVEVLSFPSKVTALNERALTVITHQTAPLNLVLSGNHHDQIPFFVFPACDAYPSVRVSLVSHSQPKL